MFGCQTEVKTNPSFISTTLLLLSLEFFENILSVAVVTIKTWKIQITLHKKPHFLFPNVLKRWSSDRKNKDKMLSQIRIGRTSVTNVNNTSNKFLIINLPCLICKKSRKTISTLRLLQNKLILQLLHNGSINYVSITNTSLIIRNDATSKIAMYLRHVSKNSY